MIKTTNYTYNLKNIMIRVKQKNALFRQQSFWRKKNAYKQCKTILVHAEKYPIRR
jgi:hypothetical protein